MVRTQGRRDVPPSSMEILPAKTGFVPRVPTPPPRAPPGHRSVSPQRRRIRPRGPVTPVSSCRGPSLPSSVPTPTRPEFRRDAKPRFGPHRDLQSPLPDFRNHSGGVSRPDVSTRGRDSWGPGRPELVCRSARPVPYPRDFRRGDRAESGT